MPSEDDLLFARTAVAGGLVSQDQVDACCKIIRKYEERGRFKTLPEAIVAKKFMTSEETRRVLREIGRNIVQCDKCGIRWYVPLGGEETPPCPNCSMATVMPMPDQAAPEAEPGPAPWESEPASEEPAPGVEASSPAAAEPTPPAGEPASAPEEEDPLVGQRLAHLEILEKLGQGGMATVYKARNVNLGRLAAVKVFPEELRAREGRYLERFMREARAAAGIDHPNVVRVYYVGDWEEKFFIEMEYVDGESLGQMIDRRGALPVEEVVEYIRQAARALEAASAQGLVHRDVKPDNLLVTREGVVKVADFGLAKSTDDSVNLTIAGQVIGTPYYIAPESFTTRQVDHRSDIYSLGITFFHAVVGRRPFEAASALKLMIMHKNEAPPRPDELNPSVPPAVAQVILKAMRKSPADRYQSAHDLIEALDRARETTERLLIQLGEKGTYKIHSLAGEARIGRGVDPKNTVALADPRCSKRHARIFRDGEEVRIEDLGSRNGTRVNGRKIQSAALAVGDSVRVGQTGFLYLEAPADRNAPADTLPKVAPDEAAWRLTFLSGTRQGEELHLGVKPVVIGRHRAAQYRLEDEGVTDFHAQFLPAGGGLRVLVLSPDAVVIVNGERVHKAMAVHGDLIGIAAAQARVEVVSAAASAGAASGSGAAERPAEGTEGEILMDAWAGERLPDNRVDLAHADAMFHEGEGPSVPVSADDGDLEIDILQAPGAPGASPASAPQSTAGQEAAPSGELGLLHEALAEEAQRVDAELGASGVSVGPRTGKGEYVMSCSAGPLQGRSFPVGDDRIVLGRDPECSICLDDTSVSREHAAVEPVAGGAVVKDLGSANGIFVNGERVKERRLQPGDILRIGASKFIVHL